MARPEEPDKIAADLHRTATDAEAEIVAPGTALPPRRGSILRAALHRRRLRLWIVIGAIGPGFVAANAGNDAGGVVTYASAGAQYGYALLWVFPAMTVSLAVVQEMAARMGAATGKGLADLIRENLSIHIASVVMLTLLVANGATVISEFVGIAASVELIHPGAQYIGVPVVAIALWLLVVKGSYTSVERVFLLMTLAFFAYPISAILARPNWGNVLHHTVVPTFLPGGSFLLTLVALIGTTITPYMQIYVQSAVVEKGITPRDYQPERLEVYGSSIFGDLISAFIVIATAAAFLLHHQVIQTAAQAARALAPLGQYDDLLFGIGLFGASVLAAAVLPLATAYSISEALGVEKGINSGFRDAPVFMGLFTGLIVLGALIALIPGLPAIQVLVLIQVLNGILLPIVLFTILKLVNDRGLMGSMVNGPVYNVIAWITAIVVSLLSTALLIVTILGLFGIHVG